MSKVSMELIQQLRERTGVGMMDCKKAIEEANGDIEKAVELLRKRGAAIAAKRADKETGEGLVHAYIHPGSRVGVLIELNCETDFVAATDTLKELAHTLCMQITALKAQYVAPENVDAEFLARERAFHKEQMASSGKPENIMDQIIDGKINKLYSEICLLKQQYIKNDQLTVEDVIKEVVARTGENIRVRRFARFELGA